MPKGVGLKPEQIVAKLREIDATALSSPIFRLSLKAVRSLKLVEVNAGLYGR